MAVTNPPHSQFLQGDDSGADDGCCDRGRFTLAGVEVGSAAGVAGVRGEDQAGHAAGSDRTGQQLIAPGSAGVGRETHRALTRDLDARAELRLDHHVVVEQGAPSQEREQGRERDA